MRRGQPALCCPRDVASGFGLPSLAVIVLRLGEKEKARECVNVCV